MKIIVINVLAIDDVTNVMKSLSKITKKSKIHIVNFPKDGKGGFIHDDNVDRFVSWKVKNQVEYIKKIKDQLLNELPSQIKLITMIKRKKCPNTIVLLMPL